MELNEKLQELRKQKGLTQEELAGALYVSRTAVSKWESGRGTPNIESLKAIAKFFSVSIDELLSVDEVLTIAEEDQKQQTKYIHDLIFGLLDVSMLLLLFLPLFGEAVGGMIRSVSLLTLGGISLGLKILYFFVVNGTGLVGLLTLALQNVDSIVWQKCKTKLSLGFGVAAVLLFVLGTEVYAAIFAFGLLAIKVILLLRRK